MGYKKIRGRIVHVRKALNDVRISIDVPGSVVRKLFAGKMEIHELVGKNALMYVPKVKNNEEEEEKFKIFEKLKLKKTA